MNKTTLTRLIGLALVMGTLSGTLCEAQNDNGRFVASTYIALLGRGADAPGWTFWVGTDLNAGVSQDNMVSQLLASPEYLNLRASFQRANAYGCGWPADWNGQFVTMLYYYGLNRCPDPSGFTFWKGVLDAGYSPGTVVWDFVNAGNAEFTNKHGAAVTAFLAAQPSAAPSASAVWFGAQPGGSDSVPVLFDGLYRTDFYDFQGSSEISQATVFVGSGSWSKGNCAVRYTPATQTVDLLDDNGNPQGSGTLGQAGVALANSHCHVDLGSSSVSSAGTTISLYLHVGFIVPGNGYGWYGEAKALQNPYGVFGPFSSSLGSVSVTGTVAPTGLKGVQEEPFSNL